jgi:hypothetical protein
LTTADGRTIFRGREAFQPPATTQETTMLVYRYENPTNRLGPFNDGDGTGHNSIWAYERTISRHAHDPYNMPAPHQEPAHTALGQWAAKHSRTSKRGWPKSMVCGFADLQDLKRAFGSTRGRVAMGRCGCYPAVYEVPDEHVLHGEAQVMFDRRKAKLVHWLAPDTLQPMEGEPPAAVDRAPLDPTDALMMFLEGSYRSGFFTVNA